MKNNKPIIPIYYSCNTIWKFTDYNRKKFKIAEDEEFRPITREAIPGVIPKYEVSNYGRVWDTHNCVFLTTLPKSMEKNPSVVLSSDRDLETNYHQQTKPIRVLVKRAFNPLPDYTKIKIKCKDGNPDNCHIDNLQYF